MHRPGTFYRINMIFIFLYESDFEVIRITSSLTRFSNGKLVIQKMNVGGRAGGRTGGRLGGRQ